MKIEEAIKTNRFTNEQHKSTINLLYTTYWLKSNFSVALKTIGITGEQHNVLRILKGSHPTELCVRDIASRILERNSNVPRIIDKLVAKKLARRIPSKEDKRETLISLTEKGISVTEQARTIIDQVTMELVMLNEQEAKILNDLLDKMRG